MLLCRQTHPLMQCQQILINTPQPIIYIPTNSFWHPSLVGTFPANFWLASLLCRVLNTTKLSSTGYHPQVCGKVEQKAADVTKRLRLLINKDLTNWDLWIPWVLFGVRCAFHRATGTLPFQLLFGCNMQPYATTKQHHLPGVWGIRVLRTSRPSGILSQVSSWTDGSTIKGEWVHGKMIKAGEKILSCHELPKFLIRQRVWIFCSVTIPRRGSQRN